MKQIIVTIALVILGVYLANTFILGNGTNSMKHGANTIANKMMYDIDSISGNVVKTTNSGE